MTTSRRTFTSIKSRNFAAGIMALVTAIVMIPGMTTYLPFGVADKIAVPILLFPFIWTGLFIYSYLAKQAWHPWAIMWLITVSHSFLSYFALSAGK